MLYWEYYLMGIVVLPGLILAIIAQTKVNTNYSKYSKIYAKAGIKACDLVRQLLDGADMREVKIIKVSGHLTDNYNPQANEICLSEDVYDSSSIAALGIACHELGHALQNQKGYAPFRARQILVPISSFASRLLWPLVCIGLFFNLALVNGFVGNLFMWAGITFFGLSVLFSLITLPVEFNASNRAIALLKHTNTLDSEELVGTKKVLGAAAFTYVAALVVAILNFLRFLIVILANRRD